MVTLKIMKSFKLFFKIIADNNCPLYERGELLTLSDKALSCPENKPTIGWINSKGDKKIA